MSKTMDKPGVFRMLYRLTSLELLRNRFGLLLLFFIPVLFLAVVEGTTGQGSLPIKLYFFHSSISLLLPAKEISLVFMAAAVSGFLTAYYAVLLFQQDFYYYRYCVSLSLSPRIFALSRFSFFFTLVAGLAALVLAVLAFMLPLRQVGAAFAGFLLLGTVYGAYGGAVGLLSKDHMVAILLIALLANLDAGWLQNPVFYSSAQQGGFIRWLPAFYPCQFIFSALFAGRINAWALLMSLLYSLALLALLFGAVRYRLKGVYHE
ncbi:MAG: hypothetical protein WBB73_07215 [Candidatus Aminicenantaceae bacterium]